MPVKKVYVVKRKKFAVKKKPPAPPKTLHSRYTTKKIKRKTA